MNSAISLAPLPMAEAQEFWADKVKLAPGDFNRLADAAKVRAFAVSGIAKGDELASVFNSLQKAIDTGISFDDFRKDCREIFARRGWTGKRAWRADNIFRTNIQTSYNVGRYQQMSSVADTFPYWMYDAVNDSRTRPTHLALDGKVFPAGHPFWDKWWPPNGFRCFPAGTPVLTPLGWRMIETIRPQDRVIGGSGDEQLVAAIHHNDYSGDLVRLVFEGGRIDTTPNHRICTMRGWVRADGLQEGDILIQTGKSASQDALVGHIDHPHAEGGGPLSAVVGFNPLGLDRLAPLAGRDAEMAQQAHKSAGVDVQPGGEFAVGKLLVKVETAEDFAGAAPLQGFDSLDDFVAWARSHAHLHRLIAVGHIPYTGTVYNLSVANDKSYIVPGATVHNCRCSVKPLTKSQVAERGLTVTEQDPTGHLILPVDPKTGLQMASPMQLLPDPGFAHHPGKAYWGNLGEVLAGGLERWSAPIGAQVVADLGQTGRKMVQENYAAWLSAAMEGKPQGNFGLLGAMNREDLEFLKQQRRLPASAGIAVEDRLVAGKKPARHQQAGDALSRKEWELLPDGVATPEAVLYDRENSTLLYVSPATTDDRKIKVVVAVDIYEKKLKRQINKVATVFKVGGQALLDEKRYTLIRGEMK